MAVKLRDHQIEAVDAIVRGLDIPPGGIPANIDSVLIFMSTSSSESGDRLSRPQFLRDVQRVPRKRR
ncbi:hypothetical protein ABZW44_38155 [Streptomyces mirabilis]|uniref:hypothetical protein n=1 Tax=Streptomyces mirabilis TaxID=68239 RepID=UPI0033A965CF